MDKDTSIMRRHTTVLSPNIMNKAIPALTWTHLHYCPAVWSNATEDLLNKLQRMQNRAAQTALSWKCRTNIVSKHKTLNWLLVKDRLLYSQIIFIRNISVLKSHFILFKNLSFSAEKHKDITTVGIFTLPKARSNGIRKTVYRGVKEWNSLPKHIKLITNGYH